MNYSNEATFLDQIENAKMAAKNGNHDAAFVFLSNSLDCSDGSAAELALHDAAYAEINSILKTV